MRKLTTIKPSAQLYITWLNDFISISCFADYYGLTTEEAHSLIARSKTLLTSQEIQCGLYDGTKINKRLNISEHNRTAFIKRDEQKLLLECSA